MKRIFIFLIVIYLIFLNAFYNNFIDEKDWIIAGQSFKNALLHLNPQDTYVGYMSLHPGVTVLWISSIIQLIFPKMLFAELVIIHRLFFLIIGSVLGFLSAKLLLKSFSRVILAVAFFYLLFDPHFIVSGNLSWLDFLLSILTLLCILTWDRFLNFGHKSDIFKTGILVGLAILTKFTGAYLYAAILVLTVFYSTTNKIALKRFVKPLFKVFCLGLITFIILYPAMWTNPKKVLFGRFNKQEAGHQITFSESNQVLKAFPQKLADINPIIFLGILFVIIELYSTKKPMKTPFVLGLSGTVYFLCMAVAMLILFDKGRGAYAFLSTFDRYLLPAVPLLSMFFFYRLFKTNAVNRFLKISIIFFLFIWEIYHLLNP